MTKRWLHAVLLAASVLPAGCAGLERQDQGRLQPQTVSGPCQVKKFFLLGLTAVQTDMTIGNGGAACEMTLLDANLQATPTAALVTAAAAHGRATAGLLAGGRQVGIGYAPQPGYVGPDRFTVTIEPNAFGIVFNVTVGPAGS